MSYHAYIWLSRSREPAPLVWMGRPLRTVVKCENRSVNPSRTSLVLGRTCGEWASLHGNVVFTIVVKIFVVVVSYQPRSSCPKMRARFVLPQRSCSRFSSGKSLLSIQLEVFLQTVCFYLLFRHPMGNPSKRPAIGNLAFPLRPGPIWAVKDLHEEPNNR